MNEDLYYCEFLRGDKQERIDNGYKQVYDQLANNDKISSDVLWINQNDNNPCLINPCKDNLKCHFKSKASYTCGDEEKVYYIDDGNDEEDQNQQLYEKYDDEEESSNQQEASNNTENDEEESSNEEEASNNTENDEEGSSIEQESSNDTENEEEESSNKHQDTSSIAKSDQVSTTIISKDLSDPCRNNPCEKNKRMQKLSNREYLCMKPQHLEQCSNIIEYNEDKHFTPNFQKKIVNNDTIYTFNDDELQERYQRTSCNYYFAYLSARYNFVRRFEIFNEFVPVIAESCRKYNLKCILKFIIGIPKEKDIDNELKINIEDTTYNNYMHDNLSVGLYQSDIIYEDYKNSTLKMAYWLGNENNQCDFTVKLDDDAMIADFDLLHCLLLRIDYFNYNVPYWVGNFRGHWRPHRPDKNNPEKKSKWECDTNCYKGRIYPPFTSGIGWVMNNKAIQQLKTLYLNNELYYGVWMEDVAFGIWFDNLNVNFCRFTYQAGFVSWGTNRAIIMGHGLGLKEIKTKYANNEFDEPLDPLRMSKNCIDPSNYQKFIDRIE